MIPVLCLLYAVVVHGRACEYHFVNLSVPWTEAQQYCREQHTDLVSLSSLEESDRLHRPSAYTGLAWIGLFDDPASWQGVMGSDSNSWRWSTTGTAITSLYQNWRAGSPNGEDVCVTTGTDGLWFDHTCSHSHVFVCYTGGQTKVYTFVTTVSLSWTMAQAYCREHFTDLAVIQSSSENDELISLVSSSSQPYIWIGLYREPWRWSDNSAISFTNWGGAGYYMFCAAENAAHLWYPQNCDQKLPFFCYEIIRKRSRLIRMHFLSGFDMGDTNGFSIIQQVEEQLNNMGLIDITVTLKSPPMKQNKMS